MKVAHVIIGLTLGGAEKVVVDLCAKSKEDLHHQFFVVSLTDDMDRKPDLDVLEVPVASLGITKNIFSFLKGVFGLRRFLKTEQIDLVHAHMFHAYLISILACIGRSTPIVFTGHSTNLGSKIRELIIWCTKGLRGYDIVFSKDQRHYYHKESDKTVAIPNGINIQKFKLSQEGIEKESTFTFLNVGNLEVEKNQISLIHIARELRENGKHFQIKIVGEGSRFSELKENIKQFNLDDTVFLLGKRHDVPQLMASSHCYLLPSLWEGMPLTILEAGMTGIPIIATPVGNIPQILNKDRGFVVEVNEFSHKMMQVMDQFEQTLIKSENLSQYIATNFSLDSSFQKHIDLYHHILH